MPGPTPHRTPLRRVSQGSLFALSRSGAHPDAPQGLGFLEPALAELADEADTLRANVEGLRALSASLDTFNEAFASWMYVMNMNALTVEWPEVRVDSSQSFGKRLCAYVHLCCRGW
jgi:DASH complex subunit DAM1